MINFNNKYLTIIALCIIVYLISNNVKDVKKLHSKDYGNKAAKYNVVIDPHKSKDDYTLMEKIALLNMPDETLKKIDDAKNDTIPPKDLVIQEGDKVFLEVDHINVEDNNNLKSYSLKVGEDSDKIESFVTDVLLGMKMHDEKIVVNPKNENDIREIKILYIERLK